MQDEGAVSVESEWRQNWPMVVAAFVGVAFSVIHIYSLGVFIGPIEREFGWSRSLITSGLTVYCLMVGILATFAGVLVDRFGPRRVVIPGFALYCVAIASIGLTAPTPWQWWAHWIFLSAGGVCLTAAVWSTAISGRFARHRGLAMAITLSGTAVGSAVFPILSTLLIEGLGWRSALFSLGGIAMGITLPLLILLFRDGRTPSHKKSAASSHSDKDLPGVTVREGFRTLAFWQLLAGSFLFTLAITSLLVHFVPILGTFDIASREAAGFAGLIGVSMLIGRISAGTLIDRFNPRIVAVIAFLLPAIACIMLLNLSEYPMLVPFIAILIGLASGSEVDIIAYLASRYFGLRNFGALFGAIAGAWTAAGGLGPMFAGLSYDLSGSYETMIWIMMGVFVVSTIPIATLTRLPRLQSYSSLLS